MDNAGNERANITLQFALVVVVLILLLGIMLAIVWADIPPRNDAAFNIFLGAVIGWMGALVSFGFPNNIGNAKKDDTIRTLAAGAMAPMTETTTRVLEASDGQRGTSASAADRGPEPVAPDQWVGNEYDYQSPSDLPIEPPNRRAGVGLGEESRAGI